MFILHKVAPDDNSVDEQHNQILYLKLEVLQLQQSLEQANRTIRHFEDLQRLVDRFFADA
jgi:hypothetical protein